MLRKRGFVNGEERRRFEAIGVSDELYQNMNSDVDGDEVVRGSDSITRAMFIEDGRGPPRHRAG